MRVPSTVAVVVVAAFWAASRLVRLDGDSALWAPLIGVAGLLVVAAVTAGVAVAAKRLRVAAATLLTATAVSLATGWLWILAEVSQGRPFEEPAITRAVSLVVAHVASALAAKLALPIQRDGKIAAVASAWATTAVGCSSVAAMALSWVVQPN